METACERITEEADRVPVGTCAVRVVTVRGSMGIRFLTLRLDPGADEWVVSCESGEFEVEGHSERRLIAFLKGAQLAWEIGPPTLYESIPQTNTEASES